MPRSAQYRQAAAAGPSPGLLGSVARIMNRALSSASQRLAVAAANGWRDAYNPLRGLTISRAVSMLEASDRGAHAEVQWTYDAIERQDATLGALVEKRTSALQQLDWDIKVREKLPPGLLELAGAQQATLKAAFARIENLVEAIEFLELAAFRGFSHLEIVRDAAGEITELAPIDQWYWVREGRNGPWKYNASATFGTTKGSDILPGTVLVRECARPINRVALICFVRKGMSQKDWDGYVETYGVPPIFVIGPTNLTEPQADEMVALASEVSGGGGGYLPGGSDIKTLAAANGESGPFRPHIDYQDEQLVLRGTGGLLTMLAESGSGTLAGSAHQEAFDLIARASARKISALLDRTVGRDILARRHPGEPRLAYFSIAANEETDTGEYIKGVGELKRAGHEVEPSQIEQKTGYQLVKKPAAAPPPEPGKQPAAPVPPVRNREGAGQPIDPDRLALHRARQADLAPIAGAARVLALLDDDQLATALSRFDSATEPLARDLARGEASALEIEDRLARAWLAELEDEDEDQPPIHNNCGTGRGGFQGGNKCAKGASREPKTRARKDHLGPLPERGQFLSPEQNESRARRAMKRVMDSHTDQSRVVIREEVGEIGIPWGRLGTKEKNFEDGFGLQKISHKHPEAVAGLPGLLSRGTFHAHDREPEIKLYVVQGDQYAVLRRRDARSRWLLTSLDDPKKVAEIRALPEPTPAQTNPYYDEDNQGG